MPGQLTELTEIVTGLGTLAPSLSTGFLARPPELLHVDDEVWGRLVGWWKAGHHRDAFTAAFENGRQFLFADAALRGRPPRSVEWKGPHKPPGDDVVPADLRIDHVYLVSCKYLSKVTLNAGPSRLFERLLVGEQRSAADWFERSAPAEYQMFYAAVRDRLDLIDLPDHVSDLGRAHRDELRSRLSERVLPGDIAAPWRVLSEAVSANTAAIWRANLKDRRSQLRMLWRLLRIGDATYFVLGSVPRSTLRLRIASSWDWLQSFALESFDVAARPRGQPEVEWRASVRERSNDQLLTIEGHVEVRWSHGRFKGSPEAKVYLDTPHEFVPGYFRLT